MARGPGTWVRCSGGASRSARMRSTSAAGIAGGRVRRARERDCSTGRSSGGAWSRRPSHFLTQLRERPRQVASSSCVRSEEHTSELQSRQYLVCRLLLEKKNETTSSHPRSHRKGSDDLRPVTPADAL